MHAGMRPLVRVWSAYPLTRCLEVGMTPPLDKLCTSDDRITVKLMNVVEIHAPTNALDESHQPLIHFDCLPFPPFTTPFLLFRFSSAEEENEERHNDWSLYSSCSWFSMVYWLERWVVN